MFAVRFAEFHQRRGNGDWPGAAADVVSMFREETAPKLWWAVLLCDAVELLQYSKSAPQVRTLPLRNTSDADGVLTSIGPDAPCPNRRQHALHVQRRLPADPKAGRDPDPRGPGLRGRLPLRAIEDRAWWRKTRAPEAAGRQARPRAVLRALRGDRGGRQA